MNNYKQTSHWIPCPNCNEKTEIKIYKDTALINFPVCCKKCRQETIVDIINLKMAKKDRTSN